jgi:hypothetical protein
MASFLLQCNICPKHPLFSDLSHLLTHVGSKGHLSHYFKAQVRSRQEPLIKEQLKEYDHWYQVNQVEKLLSQRMILKDSKNSNVKSKTKEKAAPKLKPASGKTLRGDVQAAPLRDSNLIANVLDPQLSSQALQSPQLSSTSASRLLPAELKSSHRGYTPRMISRGASPKPRRDRAFSGDSDSFHGPSLSDAPRIFSDKKGGIDDLVQSNEVGSVYPEPPEPLQPFDVGTFRQRLTTPVNCRGSDAAALATDVEGNAEEEIDEFASECTKLKGVCWPGMDVFDSASPEARRKRNQKKDGSILEQMKANSASVEPTELIFFEGGEFKKSRYISGQVESSPIREEPPKPKRQRTRNRRVPLSTVCGNTSRMTKNFQAAKASGTVSSFVVDSLPGGFDRQQFPAASQSIHTLGGTGRSSIHTDHELEWSLMIAGLQENKRRDFEVYNKDLAGSETTMKPSQHEESPTRSYPFLYEKTNNSRLFLPPHGLRVPQVEYNQPHPPLRSPVQFNGDIGGLQPVPMSSRGFQAPSQFRFSDNKENIQPILDQTGRIADVAAPFQVRRSTQRYFATQSNGSTQYFKSLPPYMDFAALQPPQQHGYSLNPLAFTLEQPSTQSATSFPWPKDIPANPVRKLNYATVDVGSGALENSNDSGDETIDEEAGH